MVVYSRANLKKEEQCAKEGIDESRSAEFRQMGDESPLFRWVLAYANIGSDWDLHPRYTI